jgi:hypothetical protein
MLELFGSMAMLSTPIQSLLSAVVESFNGTHVPVLAL